MTVRSERPSVAVSHSERDWVNAKGSSTVKTTEGATFQSKVGRHLLAANGRHLLNPVYEEVNHFAGPDTPAFRYKTAPNPAQYSSDLTVRSEKPWAEVYHKERDWVNAEGKTKVDTWEGAKFQHRAGKGYQETKFYSGKRAFEVNRQAEVNVNFPETDIRVAGGQPIHVDQEVHVTPPIANETIAVATGDGPQYRNEWAVNVGSSMSGHGR